jgi:hypothetical protein
MENKFNPVLSPELLKSQPPPPIPGTLPKKEKKGRPAKISFKSYDPDKGVAFIESLAQFHCWGSRPPKKPQDDKPRLTGSETVGICELPNGQVRLVQPERIQFLDVP